MKRVYLSFLLGFSFLYASCLFTGCENDAATNSDDNKRVPVTIGISDFLWDTEQSNSRANASLPESINIATGNTKLIATLESSDDIQTRSTALTSGVRYRIIAYKENNITPGGYVNHVDYVVDNELSALYLPPYNSYTLVCYSYGTATDLPAFDKSSTTISVNPNLYDFMYCKKNVTIKGSENYFSAVMSHLFSKVTVVVDTSTDGFNITACSGTLKPCYSASVSLTDGGIIKGSSVTRSVTWPSLNSTVITSNPVMVCANAETVTMTLNSITIACTSGNVTTTNKSFTFTNKTMQGGQMYTLKIGLKYKKKKPEAAVEITGSSVYWAKGVLEKLTEANKTFLCVRGTPEYVRGDIPGQLFRMDPFIDHCSKVIPGIGGEIGVTWRMPTVAELYELLKLKQTHGGYNCRDGWWIGGLFIAEDASYYSSSFKAMWNGDPFYYSLKADPNSLWVEGDTGSRFVRCVSDKY